MKLEPLGSFDNQIRVDIYRSFVDRGHPPAISELARHHEVDDAEILAALRRLAEAHILILGPREDRIAAAPPFSAVPSVFWVETSRGSWWASCIWEALGIAALVETDARVVTSSGAQGEPLEIVVADGAVRPADAVTHIPVPARSWWKDITFT